MEVPGKRRRGRPERHVGERIVRGGSAAPSPMEASHEKHRPHMKVGNDAKEEEGRLCAEGQCTNQ